MRYFVDDTIVTVDWFDCEDTASYIMGKVCNFPSCHVGLCHGDKYLFPTATGKSKWHRAEVVYYHYTPHRRVCLPGRESEGWKEKCVGKELSSPFWRCVTEPIWMIRDMGVAITPPSRYICVDVIAEILTSLGIPTEARTPLAFYKELRYHPHRIG